MTIFGMFSWWQPRHNILMTATQDSKQYIRLIAFWIFKINKTKQYNTKWKKKANHKTKRLWNFDVTTINFGAEKYEYKIHRINAITIVQIKLHSFVNPALIKGIFNMFVTRAKESCSEKYLDEELNVVIDTFVENGHDRYCFNSIIRKNKHQVPKTENTGSIIVKLPWIPTIGPKIRK